MSTAEATTAAPDYLAEFQIFLWLTGVLLIVLPFLTGAADVGKIAKTIKRAEKHAGVWHQCDDPALKGKWHWSCCDNLKKVSYCTKYPELVGLKTKVVGLMPLKSA